MINKTIEKLLYYAETKLCLNSSDVIYKRNQIYELLNICGPIETDFNKEEIITLNIPDALINDLEADLKEIIKDNDEIESKVTSIMGILSPLPSEVESKFWCLHKINPADALDYLYYLSVLNYYVQKTKIDKNEFYEDEDISISINLSKPEKNNNDIKKLASSVNDNNDYPKCVLCKENVGFKGKNKFSPRQNLRTINFKLDNSSFFLQFSPYGYFNRHCIVISNEHTPMKISRHSISSLLDFVDLFPCYFIGSNSDLPITGGSILNHQHFQGGMFDAPIFKRKCKTAIKQDLFKNVEVCYLDWHVNTFLLKSKNKEEILEASMHLIDNYYDYNNESVDIISFTDARHACVTPLVRKINDVYHVYVVLRNNRCNETYAEGIFHAHPEYHHIKKEAIGVIECSGLFILPARLKRQIKDILNIVKSNISFDQYSITNPDIVIFKNMIEQLQKNSSCDEESIYSDILYTCKNILNNAAIFKNDNKGNKALSHFIKQLY